MNGRHTKARQLSTVAAKHSCPHLARLVEVLLALAEMEGTCGGGAMSFATARKVMAGAAAVPNTTIASTITKASNCPSLINSTITDLRGRYW